ncbi:DNA-3-methyladenine glycosylase [Lederbergia lenta]|uniref:Putative 3-methyladenine DNA glycosylase n=1 Tax=Lederbergia lenta TaxID=1467 RepID=A0A2X4Z079_LEDLE|nr:DNA-3-methyladenine glycosylase [Lederbergia lenta]MEC2325663.1 DNA-3-methyladenine glycosylase [Lederbergia lenta]SQI54024.1 3-methyladenine DNA glycosylase [Lederbergia lenta]
MNRDFLIEPVEEEFFQKPTLQLAQALLGCLLVKETDEGITSGFIVETEGYMGPLDRAAHSFGNRRTKRTEIMFGKAGLVYTYTMHTHCLVNVVSAGIDEPEAVLIRAVEPYTGVELMQRRRPVDKQKNLTNGPGKLTKAMGINKEDYGRLFYEPPLYIAAGYEPEEIAVGPRIGIGGSGEAQDYPWRFWVKDNPYVSR